ncbi:hypothetical protein Murka_0082 [Xanthomonas phage Murka]|nr:hypothetical protein Murka_0082 [Xanthomonas phage Murka]
MAVPSRCRREHHPRSIPPDSQDRHRPGGLRPVLPVGVSAARPSGEGRREDRRSQRGEGAGAGRHAGKGRRQADAGWGQCGRGYPR